LPPGRFSTIYPSLLIVCRYAGFAIGGDAG